MSSGAVPGSILLEFYPRYVRLPGQYQILKGNPVPSVRRREEEEEEEEEEQEEDKTCLRRATT